MKRMKAIDAALIPSEAGSPAPVRPIFAAGIQNSVVVQGNTAQTLIVDSFAFGLEEQLLGDQAPALAAGSKREALAWN